MGSDVVYPHKASELYSINIMRKKLGLQEIKPTIKKCLTCDKPFMSEGPANRQCLDHRRLSEDIFPGTNTSNGRSGHHGRHEG